MSLEVENKWHVLPDKLENELADASNVAFQIPDWDPVPFDDGMRWIKASIYEGYYVKYRIERSKASIVVRLKKWEFGESEPEWPLR